MGNGGKHAADAGTSGALASSRRLEMRTSLDEQSNVHEESGSDTGGQGRSAWESASRARVGATPPAGAFPMQNSSHVKFEPPTVPVIFVLGGPGSGKVTHCDNLMQERRGVVHINMTDLLQQYAIGNDMQDFGTLSSKTVTEVLMLEMKMAPTAHSYLVSGYPRSMRDVAEYSDKIQSVSGVVLVSWRQRVLERQIDYGAKLGHVVLSLAKMELKNFYKNVMPVADYFDQSNMLIAVNGERNPEEVYKDFRAAVLQILGSAEDVSASAAGIPGDIVGVEPEPVHVEALPAHVEALPAHGGSMMTQVDALPSHVNVEPTAAAAAAVAAAAPAALAAAFARTANPKPELIRVRGADARPAAWPAVVCVIGGPGSNKAALCQRAVTHHAASAAAAGWAHFSLGQRLRALADSAGGAGSEAALARAALGGGELAPRALAARLVREALAQHARQQAPGLVVDGYPRDLEQLGELEKELKQAPRMVLLDCSKLQLGRGRRDDSVAAFRRRLELFRELSLPMLKALDSSQRLTIVDGDTDAPEVQAEFTRVLHAEMERAAPSVTAAPASPAPPRTEFTSVGYKLSEAMSRLAGGIANGGPVANGALRHGAVPNGTLPNGGLPNGGLPNGGLPNGGFPNGALPNGGVHNGALPNGVANGFLSRSANRVRPMVENGPKIPSVSQLNQEAIRRLYERSDSLTVDTHM